MPLDGDHVNHFISAITDSSNSKKTLLYQEIRDRIHLEVPPEYRAKYMDPIFKLKQIISISKANLGRSRTVGFISRIAIQFPNPSFLSNPNIRASSRQV